MAVESVAQEIVRRQVEKEVAERLSSLENARLVRLASRALGRNQLAEDLPRKVAAVVAEMQDPGCPCRKVLASAATKFLTLETVARSGIHDRLVHLIRAKYLQTAEALLREVRIFTGANTLVFLLLVAVTILRRRAGLHLILPVVVLTGAATLVACLYIFGQSWLHTIVFHDYVGFAYFAYLGVAAAFLADIVFNRGQISTAVINVVLNVAGATIQAVPC
ncbi:MAG TPA: hypothetical protein VEK57_06770 [Thermoanaerobaculia bacterium]|nr:hypothetical protein [Thermoanaerobaculia bacterium]